MRQIGMKWRALLLALSVCLLMTAFAGAGLSLRAHAASLGELFGDIFSQEYPEDDGNGGSGQEDGAQEQKQKNKKQQSKKQQDKEPSQPAGQTDGEEQPQSSQQAQGGGQEEKAAAPQENEAGIEEDGTYTSREEVAAYLHEYGHLPDNYITKKEAEALGWVSSEANLGEVAPGKSIGGSRFGNYEGLLPEKKGRNYYECDIDYTGGRRNAKRIVYSDDGLIFYTEDHYESFEQLY